MQVISHIEIRDGVGYLRGRNLKAKMVARMHLWEHQPIAAVMQHYGLSAAEVYAALAFYYDNQAALDAEYAAQMARLQDIGTSADTFRAQMEQRRRHE